MPFICDAMSCLGRVLCPIRSKIVGSIDNYRMCPLTLEFGRFWKEAGRLRARTQAPEFVCGGHRARGQRFFDFADKYRLPLHFTNNAFRVKGYSYI